MRAFETSYFLQRLDIAGDDVRLLRSFPAAWQVRIKRHHSVKFLWVLLSGFETSKVTIQAEARRPQGCLDTDGGVAAVWRGGCGAAQERALQAEAGDGSFRMPGFSRVKYYQPERHRK